MHRQEQTAQLLRSIDQIRRWMMNQPDARASLPTRAQVGFLHLISEHGTQSIKDLAATFGMTSSGATQLVDGLVKAGLVTRSEDVHDRRKICLAITVTGQEHLAHAKDKTRHIMERLFSVLNDEELSQLAKLHDKLAGHLEQL